MSLLFEPMQVGNLQIKNRFVHSATCENMATERGEVTDDLVKRYQRLARGEVGLIIPGYLYIDPLGRGSPRQTGIHRDDLIPGLKRVADTIHEEGGLVVFQLAHAGMATSKAIAGQTPVGPSDARRNPIYFFKPKKMTEAQIQQVVRDFGQAARRAVEAGADGIQIHAAHGYLVSEFLSPFFNDRDDAWGGSDENRFRFLKEVLLEVRKVMPEGMPLLVKFNGHDHIPQGGIMPPLAAKYAGWMAGLGIDGLEVSCGTVLFSPWNECRGDVPVDEMADTFSWWMRPLARWMLKSDAGKYDLEEGYNLEPAKRIRPAAGDVPLFLVGGMRRVSQMEEVLGAGHADFISMSRPFIREPHLVRRIREGKTDVAACQSCNKCLVSYSAGVPVRCYYAGLPQ